MQEADTRIFRLRRLLAVVGGAGLLAVVATPTAAALELPNLTSPDPAAADLPEAPEEITGLVMPDTPGVEDAVGPVLESDELSQASEPALQTAGAVTESLADTTSPVPQSSEQLLPDAPADAVTQAVPTLEQTLEQGTGIVAESVTPVLETAQVTTAEPLLAVTGALPVAAGVETAVTSTVEGTVEPLLQQALPALDPVVETTVSVVAAALDDTVAATTGADVVTPVIRATQPVADGVVPASLAGTGLSHETSAVPAVVADESASALSEPTSEAPSTPAAPASSKPERLPAPNRRASGAAVEDSRPVVLPAIPGVLTDSADTSKATPTSGDTEASLSSPSAPVPFAPGGHSGLASASASAGGGALVLLLAALAAALTLAVPGLGRRLRPRLAPWPQPILQVSLERPG